MQIQTIQTRFEIFECKFDSFEQDSIHSNAYSNHSNGIQSIGIQIRTILSGFKAFECKFEPLEWDSKHSNANSNHFNAIQTIRTGFKGFWSFRMQIQTTPMGFEALECKFEPFEGDSKYSNANSNHSNGIRNIRLQIRTTLTRFKPFERDSKDFEAFECKFKPLQWDLKHWNANSNHSKGIQSIRMQIRTTRMGFETFDCKFEPL